MKIVGMWPVPVQRRGSLYGRSNVSWLIVTWGPPCGTRLTHTQLKKHYLSATFVWRGGNYETYSIPLCKAYFRPITVWDSLIKTWIHTWSITCISMVSTSIGVWLQWTMENSETCSTLNLIKMYILKSFLRNFTFPDTIDFLISKCFTNGNGPIILSN